MSKKDGILDVPIKKIWFEKIAAGEKNHEYRRVCPHWCKNIGVRAYRLHEVNEFSNVNKIRLRCGQNVKAADTEKTMLFEIEKICVVSGMETDLKIDDLVFDIKLGKRLG